VLFHRLDVLLCTWEEKSKAIKTTENADFHVGYDSDISHVQVLRAMEGCVCTNCVSLSLSTGNPSSNLVDFGKILKIVLNEVKCIEINKPLV
jgi:recombinational DNA repair protein (RecF pathway)